ncbi:methylmalonyl-CoA mutase family protein [Faecalibacter rhinopitheci]|uniref:Methylmalonyl-CoA mutase n=1 Tax=Faecalibacter rhinopitheci TaxID=2779678 RepID=A0A8J7FVH9_9FLAO|nr:methylmalonyl-CoA mutase family protein [Faecalibacter rhinopitheci]MBF0596223.1 methylmalonyl-CoA mutase [Faecalibacter rhinopitheci]
MSNLFDEFDSISEKQWKNKVQVELKGLEYNETLVWGTNDQINVKPLYTINDIDYSTIQPLPRKNSDWKIISNYTGNADQDYSFLYGFDINYAPLKETKSIPSYLDLFINIDESNSFDELDHLKNLKYLNLDIFGYYAQNGLWQTDTKEASYDLVRKALATTSFEKSLAIQGEVYQNAGANHVQQLAIVLAHAVEYLEEFGTEVAEKIYFRFAVGSNYFFEIAKLRAFRFLWKMILEQYNVESEAVIYTTNSLRNKSKLDRYNNVIRTSVEANAAILGGSDIINVKSYDELYETTDFGLEIAAKQQLLLQKESNLDQFTDPVAGSYYVENLTNQMAENALELFKNIQNVGGFTKALENETIQDYVYTSARKEQKEFDHKELSLIGVNKYRNTEETIENQKKEKVVKAALFIPIVPSRLAEKLEKK